MIKKLRAMVQNKEKAFPDDKVKMSDAAIQAAIDALTEAIVFCKENNFPEEAIRIRACGGSFSDKDSHAVFLVFSNKKWSTQRDKSVGTQPQQTLIEAWMEVGKEHKKLAKDFDCKKILNQDLWRFSFAKAKPKNEHIEAMRKITNKKELPTDTERITDDAIQGALDAYAAAIDFCSAQDFPSSTIRVRACAGARSDIATETVFLEFNGEKWVAVRKDNWSAIRNASIDNKDAPPVIDSWLEVEEDLKKKAEAFGCRKVPNENLWRLWIPKVTKKKPTPRKTSK